MKDSTIQMLGNIIAAAIFVGGGMYAWSQYKKHTAPSAYTTDSRSVGEESSTSSKKKGLGIDYARETSFNQCFDFCRDRFGSGAKFQRCWTDCMGSFNR